MSEPTDVAPAAPAAVWALVLALLTEAQRRALQGVAYLTRIESYPAGAPGWIAAWAIRQQVARPLSNSALTRLVDLGLLEQWTNCYRLTPLGAEAARRVGEG